MHGVILATLLELCDNPNTLSHILNWRGDGGQTAPGLLLQLWREEEEELNVSRGPHGGITGQSPVTKLGVMNFFRVEKRKDVYTSMKYGS